jgi:hypothetical protein
MSVFSSAMNAKFVQGIIHLIPIQNVLISVRPINIVLMEIVLIIASVRLAIAVMAVIIMELIKYVQHLQSVVAQEVLINAKLLQQTLIVLELQRIAMAKQKKLQQM